MQVGSESAKVANPISKGNDVSYLRFSTKWWGCID